MLFAHLAQFRKQATVDDTLMSRKEFFAQVGKGLAEIKRGEGICFAMQTLINKIGMAVGAFIGVISFAASGIDAETGRIASPDTLWNMLVLSGVISMFACAVPMFFYTITEKRQAEMVAEIEARKSLGASK